ncbi:MAG: hypothetical protein JWO94_2670 [Verrucomicrobiaceae bacterium]|nr:hypothetical protein [Verrucomicrobiaceae bacterium]
MLTPRYIVGFTGHRSGIHEQRVKTGLADALRRIKIRAAEWGGQAELFASIAEGSDVLCVETARELDLPVHLILPLPEELFLHDFTSPASWARSRSQIELCRQNPQRDSVRLSPGETTRPECYFNAAMVMLQTCDVLIAVHDHQPSRGIGGTGDVVAHARLMSIPVVTLDPATGAVEWDPGVEGKIAPDPRTDKLAGLARTSRPPGPQNPGDPVALQACLDKIAVSEARRFRPSTVRILMLQGGATLLAAMATYSFQPAIKPVLAAFEMLLVCVALWMTLRLKRRQTRERWVDARFACELLRGLRASLPLLDPLDPLIARHHSEWRRFALSAGLFVQNHATTFDVFVLRERYLEHRLGKSSRESQVLHFERYSESARRSCRLSGWFGDVTSVLAPFFVLISLLNKVYRLKHAGPGGPLPDPLPLWLAASLLPIALPLVAGVAGGLRQALDADRRVNRYPEMVTRLILMRQWLSGLQTPSSIRTAVSRCEGLLLDELEEWRVVARNTGIH